MSYTAVRTGFNDTYTTKYYQLMTERLLSLLYIWCFVALTSCFAQKESISDLYTQLDRAIEQSQHYVKLKESSIAQLKELIHQEKNPKLLLNTYRKIYSEYKSYQSDSAVAYIQKAVALAQKEGLSAEVAGLKSQLALQYSAAGAFAEALEVLKHIDKETLDESNRKDYYLYCISGVSLHLHHALLKRKASVTYIPNLIGL